MGHTVSPAPETAPCRSIWERLSVRPGRGPECPASPPSGPQLRPGTPRPLQPRPAWILKPTQLGQEPLWGCLWSGSTEDRVPETGFLIHGRGNHLPPRPGPHLHSKVPRYSWQKRKIYILQKSSQVRQEELHIFLFFSSQFKPPTETLFPKHRNIMCNVTGKILPTAEDTSVRSWPS